VAEDLTDLTAMAPWWVGVVLAMVSYMVLHAVAQRTSATILLPGQVGSFVFASMWSALAGIGQYVLPFLFLLGAGMSAFKRHRAAQLHDAAANRDDGIANMTWPEFEVLVGEYFRRQGFKAIDNGGGGPDGGVDVLLQKGSDRYLVQCKHWRALRVGAPPVRELYGVMAARRVAGGFVVTSGEFTEEAHRFAEGREIQLIDGKALQRGIRSQAASMTRPTASPAPQPRQAEPVPMPSAASVPNCPLCNASMVLRQARNGPTSGKRFWGCSNFAETKCRGTREMV